MWPVKNRLLYSNIVIILGAGLLVAALASHDFDGGARRRGQSDNSVPMAVGAMMIVGGLLWRREGD